MVKSFACGTAVCNLSRKETMETVDKLLQLHGYETSDLIHQYYVERYQYQLQLTEAPFGQLTIKCAFNGDNLEVSVANHEHYRIELTFNFNQSTTRFTFASPNRLKL